MHNISHNDVAHPAIPLATCQLLLIGQLTGSPTFSAALALLVVSRPVARECRGNVRAGNVQGAMSVSRCIVVVNKSRRRSTSCITPSIVERVVAGCTKFITHWSL